MIHDAARARDVTWPAELDLAIEARVTGSLLTTCRHVGPLRVQRPFYPEGREVCHVCLLHPPGGLVSGDELAIDVHVGPGARGLVTTPAAAKVYRSDGRRAKQKHRLSVAAGAVLEWLPQETIVFDGALVDLGTMVALEPGAIFVGWDVLCFGRPAIGERFTAGRCRTRFEIHRGAPLYVDRAVVEGGSAVLSASYGLAGHAACGTMVVVGADGSLLELARATLASSPSRAHLSATEVGHGDVLVCRYLGPSASRGREAFASVWTALRPALVGRVAVAPRIWST